MVDPSRIFVFGRSLGGCVTARGVVEVDRILFCTFPVLGGSFRKLGVPLFGVLMIRILLFRVLY